MKKRLLCFTISLEEWSVYEIKESKIDYLLNVLLRDRYLFKLNDLLGETEFYLDLLFEEVIVTQKPISLTKM